MLVHTIRLVIIIPINKCWYEPPQEATPVHTWYKRFYNRGYISVKLSKTSGLHQQAWYEPLGSYHQIWYKPQGSYQLV
jgi:hypothetical protein